MSDIFISYVNTDRDKAQRLAEALEAEGWSVWWDRDIPPGSAFDEVITGAIEAAHCMLVLWSTQSVNSDWVRDEAEEGRNRGILVPVLLDTHRPPMGFRRLQAADLSDWNGKARHPEFRRLCTEIAGRLGSEQPLPPSAPPPAGSSDSRSGGIFKLLGTLAGLGLLALLGYFLYERNAGVDTDADSRIATPSSERPLERQPTPPIAATPDEQQASPIADSSMDSSRPDWKIDLVPIDGGCFQMGSPEGEDGRDQVEGPRRQVCVTDFMMGRTEVTFTQYDAFAGATGGNSPDDTGWGRVNRPVIDISWQDAADYGAWYGERIDRECRLPTEAEWEYAARAGTTTAYALPSPSGSDDIRGQGLANCDGCGSQWDFEQTAPVGSFEPNAWGLYDMHGNVWEWVQDCWHDNYQGAPSDGSAWLEANGGDCGRRVLRGGSWYNDPEILRSASRLRLDPVYRSYHIGFRVVCRPH